MHILRVYMLCGGMCVCMVRVGSLSMWTFRWSGVVADVILADPSLQPTRQFVVGVV